MNQTLRDKFKSKTNDDGDEASSSSSHSSSKPATSFVSKGWSAIGKKLKSVTSGKASKEKIGNIENQQSKKDSSSMDCSPPSKQQQQQQMIYKTQNNMDSFQTVSTASSITLASSSSLVLSSSHSLGQSNSFNKMETDEPIASRYTKTASSNEQPGKPISSNVDRINEKVETLVLKVLSADTIKLISYIAQKFESISKHNSNDPEANNGNTTIQFCGRKEPSVSLNAFMLRLVTLLNWVFDKGYDSKGLNSTGMRYLMISIIYIEKALNLNSDLKLTSLNIHRLFLGATIDAMTFYEDSIPDKTIMARIGGVDEKQIRILGARFFKCLDYRLWIDPDIYVQNYKNICSQIQIEYQPEIPSWQM